MQDKELLAYARHVSGATSDDQLREIFSQRLSETLEGRKLLNNHNLSMKMIGRIRAALKQ